MSNSNVGIKDVAFKAKVSVSTVSKVLKNYPNISKETKERVLKVVQETGYVPNSVASALASKTKNRTALYIYINLNQQIDEINMLYIMGAFSKARELNNELVTIFDDAFEAYTNEECAVYLRSIYVDSIIVFGLNKEDEKIHYLMNDERFKVVIVDADITAPNISCVMVDQTRGQKEVAERILKPHDRVLYLSGSNSGYVTDLRLQGMRQLEKELELDMDVVEGQFSETIAYDTVKNRKKEYDAIVCASDMMAIGARNALGPDSQVRISGFDGIRLMGYVAGDVITCRQDFYQIGAMAVEAAENLRQGLPGRKYLMPYEITRISR